MLQLVLGGLSGVLVGFVLGVVGGGGSILAVPLMLYVVGVGDPHVAIGTSALAVAVNAVSNLVIHARRGNVRWPCASVFALAGIAGAYLGSSLGKAFDGRSLLALFAVAMIVVGIAMLRRRNTP
ncbi:sulfite exporter TauE/SafE family protein, partial [Corallococcus sp. CA041A]